MRASGLNALDTYVEWSLHNPHDGEYNWEGIADVVKFLEIAQEEDFYIIIRPGPYICAERDNARWSSSLVVYQIPVHQDADQ
ncbi:GD22613 [Drosophila simulans]|uniref:GD22613 n=1 Tax=Drosophila simulans TaxID=7240 RepID=B4Q458_DROSI|nr:GD22613 [Drosophila simulans]